MKRIVCDRLASLVCMKTTRDADNQEGQDNELELDNGHLLNKYCVHPSQASSSSSAAAAATSPEHRVNRVERLLASINELLEAKIRNDVQLRLRADRNQQIMNEWMIAAAVIDRLCFIVFSVSLIVGSFIFYLFF